MVFHAWRGHYLGSSSFSTAVDIAAYGQMGFVTDGNQHIMDRINRGPIIARNAGEGEEDDQVLESFDEAGCTRADPRDAGRCS